MRVLVACEFSGVVRRAFASIGHSDALGKGIHEVWSCDLLPSDDNSEFHIQGNVLNLINAADENGMPFWDLMIAHPPCTYLTVSGLHWNKKDPERAKKTEEAIDFVQKLLDAPIERIALENPVGIISTRIRKPDQIIQPYEFGHDASKRTCLWLKNLPKLQPTKRIEPRLVNSRPRWSNQTDSGQNRLGPSPDRWKLRSVTYEGIALAMAEQWG